MLILLIANKNSDPVVSTLFGALCECETLVENIQCVVIKTFITLSHQLFQYIDIIDMMSTMTTKGRNSSVCCQAGCVAREPF